MRGRICFTGKPRHTRLQQLAAAGAKVKKTQITDIFTLEDFHTTHDDDEPVILFLHDPDRGLRPAKSDLEKVAPGTTIYVLMVENEEPDRNQTKPAA